MLVPLEFKPNDLTVIIPVGGEATRLRPLTAEVSKAVVRIFNRPVVEFALAKLALQGVKNFVFGAKGYINYRSLFAYFEEGIGFSARYNISPRVHIKYQPHIDDVGSADSVRVNMDYYNVKGPVMVVQGDNMFELNLADLLAFHEEKKGVMTIVLTSVEDVERYGIADLENDNRIMGFVEKPKKTEAPSALANTGIYLLSPSIKEVFSHPLVQAMIQNGRLDFGMDFIPFLAKNGYPIYGYALKGDWYDVGTHRGYLDTMVRGLRENGSSIFHFGEPVPGLKNVWIHGQSAESIRRKEEIVKKVLEGKVRFEGSVLIGRHCQIGDGTTIEDSCIDNFCILGENVTVRRSAIMDRTVLGEKAQVNDSITGRHVRIKSSWSQPTSISDLSVIGDDVVIGEGCNITTTRIFPHKIISPGVTMINGTID